MVRVDSKTYHFSHFTLNTLKLTPFSFRYVEVASGCSLSFLFHGEPLMETEEQYL